MADSEWFAPAIVLCAIGLVLQGAKALWDLWITIRQRHLQLSSMRLQWLNAILGVIDSSPGADGERIAAKRALIEKHLPADLQGVVASLLSEES